MLVRSSMAAKGRLLQQNDTMLKNAKRRLSSSSGGGPIKEVGITSICVIWFSSQPLLLTSLTKHLHHYLYWHSLLILLHIFLSVKCTVKSFICWPKTKIIHWLRISTFRGLLVKKLVSLIISKCESSFVLHLLYETYP